MRRKNWVIAAIVVGALILIAGVWLKPFGRKAQVAYRTEAVQRGDISLQVSATGTLNAVTTVQVGSQVSGTIAALYVDFNDKVKQGQVLALLDPTFLKAQVAQAEADLDRANVQVKQAERDYLRQKPLREQGLASQAEIDALESALDAAKASGKSAEASVDRARTNLRYATITSPIDGIVVSRNVDVGQTVAASLSAPTLYTIANDLTQMQLEASVDEADIGMIATGQKVTFTVDAYPDRVFQGSVHQIRLAPQTIQNVVSYTVIVRVENPEQRLLPGMTANATFLVDQASGVLKVPVAALRFRPAQGSWNGAGRSGAQAATAPGGRGGPGGAPGGSPGGQPGVAPGGAPGGAPGSMTGGREGRGIGSGGPAVFVLDASGKPKRVAVRPGLSDGTYTAVQSDSLSEGATVIVGLSSGTGNGQQQQGTVNPFMPGGGRGPGGGRR
jgi:HlyD family secretion protein